MGIHVRKAGGSIRPRKNIFGMLDLTRVKHAIKLRCWDDEALEVDLDLLLCLGQGMFDQTNWDFVWSMVRTSNIDVVAWVLLDGASVFILMQNIRTYEGVGAQYCRTLKRLVESENLSPGQCGQMHRIIEKIEISPIP